MSWFKSWRSRVESSPFYSPQLYQFCWRTYISHYIVYVCYFSHKTFNAVRSAISATAAFLVVTYHQPKPNQNAANAALSRNHAQTYARLAAISCHRDWCIIRKLLCYGNINRTFLFLLRYQVLLSASKNVHGMSTIYFQLLYPNLQIKRLCWVTRRRINSSYTNVVMPCKITLPETTNKNRICSTWLAVLTFIGF